MLFCPIYVKADGLMIIRIDDIPAEGRTLEFGLSRDSLNERLGVASKINCLAEPSAVIHLDASGKTVVAHGSLQGEFSALCARCAEEIGLSIKTKCEMVFKPARDNGGDEDVQLSFYDGERINLLPMAEEQLILAIPMTTLCNISCRGLCPKCGVNRNTESCSCKTEPDERFQVFKDLKLDV
jgi:uncharacterized protein